MHRWRLRFEQCGPHPIARVLRDDTLNPKRLPMPPALAACYSPVWLSPPGKPLTQRPSFRTSPVCDGDLAPGDVAHVVRVADHRTGSGQLAPVVACHAKGVFPAVQRDIRQQRADHRPLPAPGWGLVTDALVQVSRFQPSVDQGPCREGPAGSRRQGGRSGRWCQTLARCPRRPPTSSACWGGPGGRSSRWHRGSPAPVGTRSRGPRTSPPRPAQAHS